MSPQPAYPRTATSHEVAAAGMLERHTWVSGWLRRLPTPVDAIVRDTCRLRVVWDGMSETRQERILAEVQPRAGLIVLNQDRRDELSELLGPPPFVLAHQLGHWLYDADRSNGLLDNPVFCRPLAATDRGRVREDNADGFATSLLLPQVQVVAAMTRGRPRKVLTPEELEARATAWGVSPARLRIRLAELGLEWCLPGPRRRESAGPRR